MKTITAFPYLQIAKESPQIQSWSVEVDGEPLPVNDVSQRKFVCDGWAVGTPVGFQCTLSADWEKARREASLMAGDILAACLVWHCPGTGLRGCGSAVECHSSEVGPITLKVEIDGTRLGLKVSISPRLFVQKLGSARNRDPLTAVRPGSILWSGGPEWTLILEGQGSMFPIALVDFTKESSLLRFQKAPWYLSWEADDFTSPLLAAVRLYLNIDHSQVRTSTEGGGNKKEASKVLWSALRTDIARMLLERALADEDFIQDFSRPKSEYDPESIGFYVQNMIRTHFSPMLAGSGISKLLEYHQYYPEELNAIIQSQTDFLRLSGDR